ncbi:hypothetical protein TeGR_g5219 [Tetraparma gracilis]|uniref:Uncharacterized protein n=1 Tax=Tetraparma gracilis TaxID=2962635 RepID=A0ABQ6MML3_9STRA|nr:hypothetical protein TeGR_g5219 [Tetraparma gracilis]
MDLSAADLKALKNPAPDASPLLVNRDLANLSPARAARSTRGTLGNLSSVDLKEILDSSAAPSTSTSTSTSARRSTASIELSSDDMQTLRETSKHKARSSFKQLSSPSSPLPETLGTLQEGGDSSPDMAMSSDPYASLNEPGGYVPRPRTESEVKVVRQRFMTEDYHEIADAIDMTSRVKDDLNSLRKQQKADLYAIDHRKDSIRSAFTEQDDEDSYEDLEDIVGRSERFSSARSSARMKRETVHKNFLEKLASKQKSNNYVRPEVRLARAKAAANEGQLSPGRTDADDSA